MKHSSSSFLFPGTIPAEVRSISHSIFFRRRFARTLVAAWDIIFPRLIGSIGPLFLNHSTDRNASKTSSARVTRVSRSNSSSVSCGGPKSWAKTLLSLMIPLNISKSSVINPSVWVLSRFNSSPLRPDVASRALSMRSWVNRSAFFALRSASSSAFRYPVSKSSAFFELAIVFSTASVSASSFSDVETSVVSSSKWTTPDDPISNGAAIIRGFLGSRRLPRRIFSARPRPHIIPSTSFSERVRRISEAVEALSVRQPFLPSEYSSRSARFSSVVAMSRPCRFFGTIASSSRFRTSSMSKGRGRREAVLDER